MQCKPDETLTETRNKQTTGNGESPWLWVRSQQTKPGDGKVLYPSLKATLVPSPRVAIRFAYTRGQPRSITLCPNKKFQKLLNYLPSRPILSLSLINGRL